MGEYAECGGRRVKIGTCEEMYYLRYDQREQVQHLHGNVDPVRDAHELRFRFPWPDEDGIAPGGKFHENGYERSVWVPGLIVPDTLKGEHYNIQFTARQGYLISLPCPEGWGRDTVIVAGESARIARNGFRGAVRLCEQRPDKAGVLGVILECGGCGLKWRCSDWTDAEPVVVALRAEADNRNRAQAGDDHWWHTVADRVAAGYGYGPSAS